MEIIQFDAPPGRGNGQIDLGANQSFFATAC